MSFFLDGLLFLNDKVLQGPVYTWITFIHFQPLSLFLRVDGLWTGGQLNISGVQNSHFFTS